MESDHYTLVRRGFQRSAADLARHAAVLETVSGRLLERLDLLNIEPHRVLDLGCRHGYQLPRLQDRYPQAEIIGLDPAAEVVAAAPGSVGPTTVVDRPADRPVESPADLATAGMASSVARWRKLAIRWRLYRQRVFSGQVFKAVDPPDSARRACISGDPQALPFADGTFDLVVSNLFLPWCPSPQRVFAEVRRVLDTGGAFLFTTTGPDTLAEYRSAWAGIDLHEHAFGLFDMHELGDDMLRAGFDAPVLDRDDLRVDYPDIDRLQRELRGVGAANIASGRRRGLMSPAVRQALRAVTAERGRFTVTLELLQGHGWKGALDKRTSNTADGFRVSVDSLRGSRSGVHIHDNQHFAGTVQ